MNLEHGQQSHGAGLTWVETAVSGVGRVARFLSGSRDVNRSIRENSIANRIYFPSALLRLDEDR